MATILIVDDLATNRKCLVTLLRHQGHRLLEAADGRVGLGAIRAEHPDLVITDVLMPVMDGYELVKQVRRDPTICTIPVVFYTAHYGEREARALALSSGVAHVLTKPAQSGEVLRVVGRVLSGATDVAAAADDLPLTMAFDREHLQLLTDKLSEKAENAESLERAAACADQHRPGTGLRARLRPAVCRSVSASASDLFGATYVTIGILDRHDHTLQQFVTYGPDAAQAGSRPAIGVSGMLGTVVSERRTVRGDNPGGDPANLQLPSLHPDVHAFLAAPIASPAHVYGWICLVGNEGRTFTEDDEHLIKALSGQVGRIYENGYFFAVAKKRTEELEHEISERRRAESALRHERDWTQRYLDIAEVILLALDTEGRITLINRKGCDLLGWTEQELLGRDWIDTCLPVPSRATRSAEVPSPREWRSVRRGKRGADQVGTRTADRMAQYRAARRRRTRHRYVQFGHRYH